MAHEETLEELDRRRGKAAGMGGPQKLEKRKARGQLNAWERMEALVDKGSFIETGLLGASSVIKADEEHTPRDGKIVGFAKIDGRDIGLCVNDFTVKGASTSATNSKKMGHVRTVATQKDFPSSMSASRRAPDCRTLWVLAGWETCSATIRRSSAECAIRLGLRQRSTPHLGRPHGFVVALTSPS